MTFRPNSPSEAPQTSNFAQISNLACPNSNRPFPHPSSVIWMGIYGALLGFSAPGYAFSWLAWLALIPALLWAYQCGSINRRLAGGFWFGFCFQALYCLWFFDLHPLTWLGFDEVSSRLVTVAGWLLIGIEGGLLTALFFATCQLRLPTLFRVIGLPILWLCLFSLLNATPMALPWGLLEYTQAHLWPARWLAGLAGGKSITLFLLLHNAAWAEFFLRKSQASRWKSMPLALTALLVPLTLHFAPLTSPNEPSQSSLPLPVAIVQANLPIERIRSGTLSLQEIESAYLRPLEQASLPPGTLALLPEEGVIPRLTSIQHPERNPFFARLQMLAHQKKIYIAVGASTFTETAAEPVLFNSVALLPPTPDQPVRFYHKRRLVPFGEYTPYAMGQWLSETLEAFGVGYSAPYHMGDIEAPLTAGAQKLGGLLCFELIDPFLAQQYKQQEATLLINLSNLGWFHENPLLEAQFLAMGQLRAAETGLPLAIASNTGISAILSNTGEILKQTIPSKWVKKAEKTHKTQIIFYNQ